ncbi:hypothetical protein [Nonomuraea sp. NPDC049709]|uniref:hypothetical protein n=1 Tax=Nonomuraea sp. NPDC049709 TaxID=3154736 RepID=UPI00343E3F57
MVLVAVVSLSGCGLSENERFARSVASMEEVARAAGGGELPREIGAFAFEDVHRDGDRVYFQVGNSTGGVDPYGYVWSPNGVPVDTDDSDAVASSFEHVRGHWYRWSDSY